MSVPSFAPRGGRVSTARPRAAVFTTAFTAAVTAAMTAALVAPAASALHAQQRPVTGSIHGGLTLGVTEPQGAFDETTGNGFGLAGNAIFALDEQRLVAFRLDAAYVNYGNVRQRVPLSPTLGNLIRVDLTTSNNIVSVLGGVQVLAPAGTIRPYAAAVGGFSAFWTSSSVEGTNNTEPFASTTNSSDFALAYGGAGGLYLRVYNGERPVYLDLGARLLRHDDVTYLTADEVRDAVANDRDPVPVRSRVDFITYYVGISIPFR